MLPNSLCPQKILSPGFQILSFLTLDLNPPRRIIPQIMFLLSFPYRLQPTASSYTYVNRRILYPKL